MLSIEIFDRGRGPELKGTRLTVYDIVPYRLAGETPEQIASVFRASYAELTAAHIEALFAYMDEHRAEVMAVHLRIETQIARGNPPEIESRLTENRQKMQVRRAELQREVTEQKTT